MDPILSTTGRVLALSRSAGHHFSKQNVPMLTLLAGLGVEGDAHMGATVQHRSRVAQNPDQPNLRQVHLIHGELIDELQERGFRVAPGSMGENITTAGIDLLGLPRGARLHIGEEVVLEVTGLRNPCSQLDHFQRGLMKAVLDRDAQGNLVRRAGIMSIVLAGGPVHAGDAVRVALPEPPFVALERV